jgi:hypothetical protein
MVSSFSQMARKKHVGTLIKYLRILIPKINSISICLIEGENQWILLNLSQLVQVKKIEIRFQGGFSSSQFDLEVVNNSTETKTVVQFYPQDNNSNQV